MNVIQYIMEVVISNSLMIGLFFKINHIRFTVKSISMAFFLRVLVAFVIATLNSVLSSRFFNYFDDPLYGLLFSCFFLKPQSKTLLIFYGLFTPTFWDIFNRLIVFFIIPFWGQPKVLLEDNLFSFLSLFLSILLTLIFLKWLRYDFVALRAEMVDLKEKKLLCVANCAMVIYYLLMQVLTYFEYEHAVLTQSYRQFILVIYLILFMGMIKQVDTHLREKLQAKLTFQQSLQLNDLERYSKHIEGLYREVRGFRHDYTNLLTTLRLGIEENNMAQIKEIYDSVLKDSHKKFRHQKYDIGRLINIQDSALKSLLAAKSIQADEHDVAVTLEVPEVVKLQDMELIDFITIVSILFDNALEAAVDTSSPKVNVAFLNIGDKQMFIIENSIKEETVNISEVYSFGHSSKGSDRGIGLYNVMKIIERYPNVSLNTRSQCHVFGQMLEIGKNK